MSDTVQPIVSKLSSLLDIRYIYRCEAGPEDRDKSLFIVIMEGNCSSLSQELSTMVAKIFQDETDSLYRIFPLQYAERQLKEGSLFFVHGCTWSNLIHDNSDQEFDFFYGYKIAENILNNIRLDFDKELEKVGGFIDGGDFFIENGNISQSAFLFHQALELLFRTVELLVMGRERKSHSIREHQNYIRAFVPELGKLFDTNREEELFLLNLLDEAYLSTRYSNTYPITIEQVRHIRKKTDDMYDMAKQLFEERIKICWENKDRQDILGSVEPKTDPIDSLSDLEKMEKIERLVKNRSKLLKPYENRAGLYKIELTTEGYLDASYITSNLLKVCILAMCTEDYPDRSIPQPNHNITEVLKLILELIPSAEMELLDELKDLV